MNLAMKQAARDVTKQMAEMAAEYVKQHPDKAGAPACEDGMRLGLLLAAHLLDEGLPPEGFLAFTETLLDLDSDGEPA